MIAKEVSFSGLARLKRVADSFLRGVPFERAQHIREAMVADGDVVEVRVEGWKEPHYALGSDAEALRELSAGRVPQAWAPLETSTTEEVVFLAPLDQVSARGRAKSSLASTTSGRSTSLSTCASSATTHCRSCGATGSSRGSTASSIGRPTTFVILGLWLEDVALGNDEIFAEALARGFARFVKFLGASTLDATAIREPLLRQRACA